ncbi:protein translocase subunit SecD [Patescibacteria group bacterium]|nr:protein translocase subunit SecD [Patescibacteria group bacterium]
MAEPSTTSPGTETFLRLFRASMIIGTLIYLVYYIYTSAFAPNPAKPFKLGLDLAGGSHLVYVADVSQIRPEEVKPLMDTLREVIERRVNVFGVSEPVVYVESSSFVADTPSERLVVELPGVTDVSEAIKEIGRTPELEFKLVDLDKAAAIENAENLVANATTGAVVSNVKFNGESVADMDPYTETGLTGRYLKSAMLEFTGGQSGQLANEPVVSITFDAEGAELFADITRANVGESLAIFLDGEMISAPTINEAIVGGTAIISGVGTAVEARQLAENLNLGALPIPIDLVSTQTIDATLGVGVMRDSVSAGVAGLAFVGFFMLAWYRLPGLVAVIALVMYVLITMLAFLLIPVTLTAAGLAGFVLSLGMAVDGNILVFERMKEEYRAGKSSREAAIVGFSRAWSAIRDGNVTALLSAVILFWFGTPLIKGFALVLGIGTIISMLSAITLTRTLLIALPDVRRDSPGILSYLFGTGLMKK